ncbi:hypothetical protein FXN61_41030 [Lentzea sp. PSKA42]|uniref:PucR C-terminal helix-turn-helix domain-containing protein n=1 Tax=Lentzea indica TaxID=2604800 RepID=A0ABX1FUQ1_9PSEU|nr:helix-turn-helix domain-containing protein [Lentzea indica]NKE62769.1 hypothetical protein [Lentzea indica]
MDFRVVQDHVDALAARLGRPVLLDDPELRPLAYSSHEDADPVRVHCILRRGVTPELMADALRVGVGKHREAFWTPELPRWQMAPRLCVPVLAGRTTLGYLWVQDADRTLTEEQITDARETAEQIAATLDLAGRARLESEHTTRQLLKELLTGEDDPAGPAAQLAAREGLPPDARTFVLVATGATATRPKTRLSVRWLAYTDEPLVLLAVSPRSSTMDDLTIAAAVRDSLTPHAIGTSGRPERLADARTAYQRALAAHRVAAVDGRGGVRSWSELGAWKLVSRIAFPPSVGDSSVDDVHPGVLTLLKPERTDLLTTAEVYCSRGGDVGETAAALHLHRSTLYYRLDRIAEITGLDPRDGEARFELMLGLRVARLAGLPVDE